MNRMNENYPGMKALNDHVVATDYMNGIKAGIKSLATALTEASTPRVRQVLRNQLNDALNTHEQFYNYYSSKGWYDAYNISHQIQMDLNNAQSTLSL